MTKFCEQNEYIAKNDDVIVGFVGWGAGGFDSSYVLTLTPSQSGDTWTDNKLMKQCIMAPFGKAADSTSSPTSTSTASPTSTEQATQKTTSSAPTGTKNTNTNESAPEKDNGAGQTTTPKLLIYLASIAALCMYLH